MPDIPTIEPEEITAGDYVQWKITDSDYPATTYTLTYALVKSGVLIEITAAADGTDHLITLSAATTAAYAVGEYKWQSYMTSGSERYNIDSGTLEVLPDFATQSTGYDDRTHVEKVLEWLRTSFESSSLEWQSKMVGGELLGKMPIQRRLEMLGVYEAKLARQRRIEARKNGQGSNSNILARL